MSDGIFATNELDCVIACTILRTALESWYLMRAAAAISCWQRYRPPVVSYVSTILRHANGCEYWWAPEDAICFQDRGHWIARIENKMLAIKDGHSNPSFGYDEGLFIRNYLRRHKQVHIYRQPNNEQSHHLFGLRGRTWLILSGLGWVNQHGIPEHYNDIWNSSGFSAVHIIVQLCSVPVLLVLILPSSRSYVLEKLRYCDR